MYSQIDSNKRKSVILMASFMILVGGLAYLFSQAMGKETYQIVAMAIGTSLLVTMLSYFAGDKIALWSSAAKLTSKEENPYLYNLVENLCITSGTPLPKIYLIEDPAINAFATGRTPETASIAVTRGAIEKLANEELEGVLAHELSHITNYDIRFMMLVAVLVGSVSILSNIFLRLRFWGGNRRGRDNGGNLAVILMLAGVLLAGLSPLIAELIKLSISRRREYLADASGSLLTRYPEGLARALEKIAQDNLPVRVASPATAHLFFANPFSPAKFKSWFSTHPPIEERIKKLREIVN